MHHGKDLTQHSALSTQYSVLSNLLFIVVLISCFSITAIAQDEAVVAWRVLRYDLTVNPAPAERALNSRAVLSVKNVGSGIGRTLTVRINPKAEIKSATVGDAQADFTKRTDPQTKLESTVISLASTPVAPGSDFKVTIDYRLVLEENSGIASIAPDDTQFLPAAFWYPTPNSPVSPRGIDTAPFRLTLSTVSSEIAVSAGNANGSVFDQPLNAQPFFLVGKWETVELTGAPQQAQMARISALLKPGATPEDRNQAQALMKVAGDAIGFYTQVLGPLPSAVPVRLVAVNRGGGFGEAGTILLGQSVFHRAKPDAATVMLIAESLVRLWIGGATRVSGPGASVIKQGLVRFFATLFIDKEYGADAAQAERQRQQSIYQGVAKRDAPLSKSLPSYDTHDPSENNKGAMVWRLVDNRLGHDAFMAFVRDQLSAARADTVTLPSFRKGIESSAGAELKALLDYELDEVTEMDLLAGLPQAQQGEWVSALRNTGKIDVNVDVVATTDNGEKIKTQATIRAQDFGEARFKTARRVASVEVDPDKLYPQVDLTNDVAPRTTSADDSLQEAVRLYPKSDFAGAEKNARSALSQAPFLQQARILLARSLMSQNKSDEAAKEFQQTLNDKLPEAASLAWASAGLGEIALQKGQRSEAAKLFTQAILADADSPATIFARRERLKADAATPDPSVVSFLAQLDTAIKNGRKTEIESLIIPGELKTFTGGIVGGQPKEWATHAVRSDALGTNRMGVEVNIIAQVLERDQYKDVSGTAVLILARDPSQNPSQSGGWKLTAVELFDVK
ncbi:MAG: hypothetical protein ACRD4L_11530 [Pyrinomonadaceae bacterium]